MARALDPTPVGLTGRVLGDYAKITNQRSASDDLIEAAVRKHLGGLARSSFLRVHDSGTAVYVAADGLRRMIRNDAKAVIAVKRIDSTSAADGS